MRFDLDWVFGIFSRGRKNSKRRRQRPALGRRARPSVEVLEDRRLLSGVHSHLLLLSPQTSPTPIGYTPAQVQQAYGFNLVNFSNGTAGTGNGQTIAIIDAYDNPRFVNSTDPNFATSDLHLFDQAFGLADPPSFTKVRQDGSLVTANNTPGVDPAGPGTNNWESEEALDVEWAHTLAPQASIILVETNSPSFANFAAGVTYAKGAPGVSVVSMSWGGSEFAGETGNSSGTLNDGLFTTPSGHAGVTFVASTGDAGQPPEYPAVSPNVLAVGGTNLFVGAPQIFSDNFNRPDSPNLGSNWTTTVGTVGTSSNQAVVTSSLADAIAAAPTLADADVSATVTVPAAGGAADLFARYSGPGDSNMYLAQLYFDGSHMFAQLFRNQGSWVNLVNNQISNASPGVAANLEFRVQGSSLQMLVNGSVVASAVDTQITAAGSVGVRGTSGAIFDDFSVSTLTPAYSWETGWNGSGGGVSALEPQPSYQQGVGDQAQTQRTAPDVAFDAGQGVAVYDSYNNATLPWFSIGGTSLSAPSWAALIAITDQGRALAGQGTLDGPTQTLPRIYTLPASDFHDVTIGNNGFLAGSGYDLVTGRGSPDARRVVADLSGNPPSATPVFSDTFNRPNSPNLGNNWATAVGSVGVSAGQAVITSPFADVLYIGTALIDSDTSVTVAAPGSGGASALSARYSGPGDGNMYLAQLYNDGSHTMAQLWRNLAGAWTNLVSNQISLTLGASTSLEFRVQGSTLVMLINGSVAASAVDTQITAAGLNGLRGISGATFANFSVSTLTPAQPPFSDNFTRPDSPNLGPNWAGGIGTVGISSNQAVVTSSFADAAYVSAALADADISATVTVPAAGGAADLFARYSGPGDSNMYLAQLYFDGSHMFAQLWNNLGGAWNMLVSNQVAVSPGVATPLEFRVQGSVLQMLVNGSMVASAVDTHITAPGLTGLRGTSGATFANFSVNTIAPPLPPFSDNFNRPDSPNLGNNWVATTGSVGVSSNQAVVTSSFADVVYAGAALADSDASATVTVPAAGGAADLSARYSGPGDSNMYLAQLYFDGSHMFAQLWRNLGSWVNLVNDQIAVSPGVPTPLEFRVQGSSLQMLVNGSVVASVVDTQITNAGLSGLRGTSGAIFDDFSVNTIAPVLPPFTDNFTRPNSPNLGNNWMTGQGTVGISNNQAVVTSSFADVAAAGPALSNTDVFAVVTVPAAGGAADLFARYSGPGDSNMYLAQLYFDGSHMFAQLWRNLGSWVNLVNNQIAVSPGVPTSLEFVVVGSTLEMAVNNTLVASAIDTQITAPGLDGMRGTSGAAFSNFSLFRVNALPFQDSFNRPNSPNLGPSWAEEIGTVGISGGQAAVTSSFADAAYAGAALSDTDVFAMVTVPAAGGAADLFARYSGPGDSNMYLAQLYFDGSHMFAQLFRNQGSWVNLVNNQIAVSPGVATPLEFIVEGGELLMGVNGVLVAAAFDTQISSAGLAGVRGTTGALFSNFSVSTVATLPFLDTFNHPSPNLGGNWITPAGASTFTVQSGTVVATASGTSLNLFAFADQADVEVSADIAVLSPGQTAELVARYSGATGNMYTGGVTENADGTFTAAIYANIGGTRTLLASVALGSGSGRLTFRVVGNKLQLFLNGELLLTTYDSEITGAGLTGIRGSNGAAFDNFLSDF
jgi:hypothetical protein